LLANKWKKVLGFGDLFLGNNPWKFDIDGKVVDIDEVQNWGNVQMSLTDTDAAEDGQDSEDGQDAEDGQETKAQYETWFGNSPHWSELFKLD
jgi:hypothetical protein